MKNEEIEMAMNSMKDTYLEEIINEHYEQTEEDVDAVDRVLSYRKMSVPLKLTVKDHHYATVLRKTGTLPPEIMFDEKYVHIENITNEVSKDKQLIMTWVVVLTRVEKCSKEMERVMGKYKAIAPMSLKEIYDRYLVGRDYTGIMIYGGNNPYPVSIERIKKVLNIEEGDK